MANKEHLKVLKQGLVVWNNWREENPKIKPNLSYANPGLAYFVDVNSRMELKVEDFHGADFSGTNLNGTTLVSAKLSGADFHEAKLIGTNLSAADLSGTNFRGADLTGANLVGANLSGADFRQANFLQTNLIMAHLSKADLSEARLFNTIFGSTYLKDSIGLDKCIHAGPSVIDHRTLQISSPLPKEFLRGCGLPDSLIDYLPSLLEQAVQHYSCFISYSTKDQEFADRLYADLQNKGVRCWLATEDLKIGDKIRPAIDDAIRLRDKLLIVLSEQSISSAWVEKEVETAFEEERRRDTLILFPIRIDDAVMSTTQAWAADIRRTRHIGDFRSWKDHDAYKESFDCLLRDLKQPTKIGKP